MQLAAPVRQPLLTPTFTPRAPAPVAFDAPEFIDTAVKVATFAPQPFWLLMIALPRARVTRALMEPLAPILALSLVHLAVVATSAAQADGTAPITIFMDGVCIVGLLII